MTLDSPITEIKGIGNELAKKFAVLGIDSIDNLVEYFPRKYNDYSHVTSIKQMKPGMVTIKATIKQISGKYVRRGMHITEAVASDSSSSARLIWFNQPYRAASIKADTEYFITGDFALRRQKFSIMNPAIEIASNFPINTARIVPIYRETKGLKSVQIRKAVNEIIELIRNLEETMPEWLIKERDLMQRNDAIETMHFPIGQDLLNKAKRRLGFEEVFGLTLAALLNKNELNHERSLSIPFKKEIAIQFTTQLPFKLTNDQRRVVWEIYLDLEKTHPMNRLIEGDVGSGKTVVATMAALMAMEQGFQVAFMSPTELLALQHFNTIKKLLKPLKFDNQVDLLTGSLPATQKSQVNKRMESGKTKLIIGTHALIQEQVKMDNLGLIIIDEQHRFGVDQRKALQKKAGYMPHVLSMTATPIPRSLALTLYGELDVSIINMKPIGRKKVITQLCSPNSRDSLNKNIDKELTLGRQVFVVCPLITESSLLDARSAEQVYLEYKTGYFKNRRISLLHGKMKSADKESIMQQFISHKIDILVSTTVIEVGVDIPNASVMVIENAERFGLAQIHQLRGRVGRSNYQGYCYLMLGDSSQPSSRFRALETISDGFELAELDLEMRGPGAIYGSMQHGQLDLRVANLSDIKLIALARKSAREFLDRGENLLQYTHIAKRVDKLRAVTNLN